MSHLKKWRDGERGGGWSRPASTSMYAVRVLGLVNIMSTYGWGLVNKTEDAGLVNAIGWWGWSVDEVDMGGLVNEVEKGYVGSMMRWA